MQEKSAIVGNEESQYLVKEIVIKLTFYIEKKRRSYFWVWNPSDTDRRIWNFEVHSNIPLFNLVTKAHTNSNRYHLIENLKQQTGREE